MKHEIEELKKRIAELEARLAEQITRWEPEGGEWFVECTGKAIRGIPTYEAKIFGVERKTKELAERAAVEMRTFNRLLAYRDEVCPNYEPDWSNSNETKFYVYYDYSKGNWEVADRGYCRPIGTLYFPTYKIAQELCDKLNAGVVVI